MAHAHDIPPKPEKYPPDYRQELADLLENEFPNARLSVVTQVFILDGFEEMFRRNGDRPYHDGMHPFDVLRKGFRWLEELSREKGMELTPEDYEVLAIASAYHDIELESVDGLTPERRSANRTRLLMQSLDYPDAQTNRVYNGILATETAYEGKEVLQRMATEVEPDVATAALLLADIGDVLYRDGKVILLAASNLAAEELYKMESGDLKAKLAKVMGIFDKQETFSDQRFLDLPRILVHHLGKVAAQNFLEQMDDQLKKQHRYMTEQADKIQRKRQELIDAFEPIITDDTLSFHEKGRAFFAAVVNLIDLKSN